MLNTSCTAFLLFSGTPKDHRPEQTCRWTAAGAFDFGPVETCRHVHALRGVIQLSDYVFQRSLMIKWYTRVPLEAPLVTSKGK
jgi:hypothetical protein